MKKTSCTRNVKYYRCCKVTDAVARKAIRLSNRPRLNFSETMIVINNGVYSSIEFTHHKIAISVPQGNILHLNFPKLLDLAQPRLHNKPIYWHNLSGLTRQIQPVYGKRKLMSFCLRKHYGLEITSL